MLGLHWELNRRGLGSGDETSETITGARIGQDESQQAVGGEAKVCDVQATACVACCDGDVGLYLLRVRDGTGTRIVCDLKAAVHIL